LPGFKPIRAAFTPARDPPHREDKVGGDIKTITFVRWVMLKV
jgi:hypothetical protein